VPGQGTDWLTLTSEVAAIEWIVVRFTESAGVRWEYNELWDIGTLADPLHRLRKVHGFRTLRWRRSTLRQGNWREAVGMRDWPERACTRAVLARLRAGRVWDFTAKTESG
jgi:hypothetical protein